jgi:hypothetical protein
MQFKLRLIPPAAFTLLLLACGGGGGGGSPSTGGTSTATSGTAVDGYLVGAQVVCDADGKGFTNAANVLVTTLAGGKFTFPLGCSHTMLLRGGTNADTNMAFTGMLSTPAKATVITPLTTLLTDTGLTSAQLNIALGLTGVDLLNTDPALAQASGQPVNADLQTRTLAVQQLMQTSAERFAGLARGSMADVQAIYADIAKSFGATLKAASTPVLVQADRTINLTVLKNLTNAASTAVQASGAVPQAIKTALEALNNTAGTNNLVDASALSLQAAANDYLKQTAAADILKVSQSRQLAVVPTTDKILIAVANKSLTGSSTSQEIASVSASANGTSTNYLYLANDSLSYHDGYSTQTTYTLAQFQSQPGISVKWPMLSTAAIKFTLADAGSFAVTAGQTLSAAVSIRDTAANSQGIIKFDIDKIDITKNGTDITLTVPSSAVAWVYGLLADGTGMALKNFSTSVAGGTATISTVPNAVSSIVMGDAINSAVNSIGSVSNMSGTYEVIVAVKGLPLSQANGAAFSSFTVDVPTSLANTAIVRSTTGFGLKGYITLTP